MKIFKNKKLRIIIILLFLLGFLIFLKLTNKKEVVPEIPIITPSPVPTLIPTIQITPGVGDENFYESIKPNINKNYPLFDFTPYETENYRLGYIKPLILKVILKKDTPDIRQEVLDWIKSNGVNPNSHTLQWELFK